jgi:hypothetical protein
MGTGPRVPVAKWWCSWGPSTLREVVNLAFLGTQGVPGTNLLSPDPFDKRVLSWALTLPTQLVQPELAVPVGHGEEAHQSLCLHLRSALLNPGTDRQAGPGF